MNIDPMHAEMNSLMPDWSPSGSRPLNTRIKERLDPFMHSQRDKLLHLREGLTESMAVVTKRSPLSHSGASPVGIHPADAGSDAYDRDFALSLLSREQDALYEIDQALRRIELGTYGICEMSGNQSHARVWKQFPSPDLRWNVSHSSKDKRGVSIFRSE